MNLDTLGLLSREDLDLRDNLLRQALQVCFKGLRKATRLFIRHARNLCRLKYGKMLLYLFVKMPSVVLKSILRTVAGENDSPTLPNDLFIMRNET